VTAETHFLRVTVSDIEDRRTIESRHAAAAKLADELEPGCTVLTIERDHTDPATGHLVYLVKIDGPEPQQ
jgi:hypothetical protein